MFLFCSVNFLILFKPSFTFLSLSCKASSISSSLFPWAICNDSGWLLRVEARTRFIPVPLKINREVRKEICCSFAMILREIFYKAIVPISQTRFTISYLNLVYIENPSFGINNNANQIARYNFYPLPTTVRARQCLAPTHYPLPIPARRPKLCQNVKRVNSI